MIPRLHLVTDDRVLALPRFSQLAIQAMEEGGAKLAVHLRGPGSGGRVLWERARELAPVARSTGSLLLINDRVDVALLVPVGGVHLPERSFPVSLARELLAEGAVVGRSVHDEKPLEAPERPDFVLAGTLYRTPSHPGQAGVGPGRVARLRAANPGLPIVGIGGLTLDRVDPVLEAGAHGVALLRAVWDHPRPAEAVARYLTQLGDPHEAGSS
jgi:thiamine-phosphate diphosphorylase